MKKSFFLYTSVILFLSLFLLLGLVELSVGKGKARGHPLGGGRSFPTPVPTPPPTEPVGTTETVEVSSATCTNRLGGIAIAGIPNTNVASFDATRNYVVWYSDDSPGQILIAKYDGAGCSAAAKVNTANPDGVSPSHDAPSVFVDGSGFVYVAYLGRTLLNAGSAADDAPYWRKSTNAHDITAWGAENKTRINIFGETNGLRLNDGAVLVGGTDRAGRFDIVEPGGAYRWTKGRQVVGADESSAGDPNTGSASKRFPRPIWHGGRDASPNQRLFLLWGWGCNTNDQTNDCRNVWVDSHEVFFAYSTDGGENWKNRTGATSTAAPLCDATDTPKFCHADPTKGIPHYSSNYRLTTTRTNGWKGIWEHTDNDVYIAFSKSEWCDSSNCAATGKSVTNPGQLRILHMNWNGTSFDAPTERAINNNTHNVLTVRRTGAGDTPAHTLYVWAKDQTDGNKIKEWSCDDSGGLCLTSGTWSSTVLASGCDRFGQQNHIPGLNSIRLSWACSIGGGKRRVYYYRRTF